MNLGASGETGTRLVTDSSSLVDLKAEVYRKKHEATFNRLHGQQASETTHRRTSGAAIWSRRATNAGVAQRARADEAAASPADRTQTLAAKARLYDQLRERGGADEGSTYLVDFGSSPADEDEDDPTEPVEYVDAWGRSRTCARAELARLQAQDDALRPFVRDHRPDEPEAAAPAPDLWSEDMRRAMLRQKWEREEEENLRKRNVHYQDVLFDEARVHGAAFYQFSRDEPERAREKEELEQRHRETEQLKGERQDQKLRRATQLQARLNQVRDRKRLKMGLPLQERPEDESAHPLAEGDLVPVPPETQVEQTIMNGLLAMRQKMEEDNRVAAARKASVREWDIGKEGVPAFKGEKRVLDQTEWVRERRHDRPSEFAPPSAYRPDEFRPSPASGSSYNSPARGAAIKAHQIVQQLREELSSDTLNIRIICTDHAKHFLERQILKELGVEVVDDSCEWTTWKTRGDPVLHIELTKWADLIVVAPLDALTLSKLANAHCDNLLTCVLIAWPLHEKPVLVCPSMNTNINVKGFLGAQNKRRRQSDDVAMVSRQLNHDLALEHLLPCKLSQNRMRLSGIGLNKVDGHGEAMPPHLTNKLETLWEVRQLAQQILAYLSHIFNHFPFVQLIQNG
eukprot:snap_masked-scaffold372_size192401-processed-gene-0.6 protein:Tk00576 transcript:snap_masked-scaffold372_size192401-processed-gene-0.6-mRNA-1 annotation:"c3orf19 homolog"